MDHEKPTGPVRNLPDAGSGGELAHNPAVDDFFRRLKQDLHHPKPGTEAIAAALQAVQRLASQADTDDSVSAVAEAAESRTCLACGSLNPTENRFCAICGVPQQDAPSPAAAAPAASPTTTPHAPGQHHYHHHYHHHYFSSAEGGLPPAGPEARASNVAPAVRGDARSRAQLGGPSLSRVETAVRKLMQDWMHACNSKQLDDLVELYGVDAVVLRPNVPPVRGTAAIREFFFGVLDAGLGEVEMDPLRLEVFGDVAYEAGRCKMLVPFTMGKRREERGKYLLILARQAGDWKVLADCWSSDLSLGMNVDSGPLKPSAQIPPNPAFKPPRKGP